MGACASILCILLLRAVEKNKIAVVDIFFPNVVSVFVYIFLRGHIYYTIYIFNFIEK